MGFTITEDQCKKLDEILKTFGDDDFISSDVLVKMFNGDVKQIKSLIYILKVEGMVTCTGEQYSDLPVYLNITDKAYAVLEGGGYMEKHEQSLKEDQVKLISEKNLQLQNEALNYQKTIREQEQRIRDLDEHNKWFDVLKNWGWLFGLVIGSILTELIGYIYRVFT